jgi:hypothetical protein
MKENTIKIYYKRLVGDDSLPDLGRVWGGSKKFQILLIKPGYVFELRREH